MTTHGSANLWDTEDKVKLKTAAKTELLLNTVKFRLAVSHTVIIGNSIIHEPQQKNTRGKTLDWEGDKLSVRWVNDVQLLGIVYEINEGRTPYLDTNSHLSTTKPFHRFS